MSRKNSILSDILEEEVKEVISDVKQETIESLKRDIDELKSLISQGIGTAETSQNSQTSGVSNKLKASIAGLVIVILAVKEILSYTI